jgi:hypothetical protein
VRVEPHDAGCADDGAPPPDGREARRAAAERAHAALAAADERGERIRQRVQIRLRGRQLSRPTACSTAAAAEYSRRGWKIETPRQRMYPASAPRGCRAICGHLHVPCTRIDNESIRARNYPVHAPNDTVRTPARVSLLAVRQRPAGAPWPGGIGSCGSCSCTANSPPLAATPNKHHDRRWRLRSASPSRSSVGEAGCKSRAQVRCPAGSSVLSSTLWNMFAQGQPAREHGPVARWVVLASSWWSWCRVRKVGSGRVWPRPLPTVPAGCPFSSPRRSKAVRVASGSYSRHPRFPEGHRIGLFNAPEHCVDLEGPDR